MKKTIIKLLSVTLISLFTGCNTEGITESIDIAISNDILKQQALISVVDLVNPEKLEGSTALKVEVLGEDANYIVTNAGENNSNLKVIDGNIILAVNPNLTYTDAVKVLLKVSGDGYLTTTLPVEIYPDDTTVIKSINIVNKSNTVQGVDYVENSTALTNNTLSTDYSIITPATKATTKTTITVDSGTIFKDADGNDISGANLTSEVAHFSLDTDEAIASFPGTLSPLSVIDENGETNEDLAFITAGFTSIDMYISGTEVKNFSKPISVSIEIPNDYINPETGNTIEIGDEIPVWSYDDDGQWTYEKLGTVSMNTDGNYNITFTTTHLSWYNLDFFSEGCNGERKLDIVSTASDLLPFDSYRLSYDLVYAVNDQIIASNYIILYHSSIPEDALYQDELYQNVSSGFYNIPNSNLKVKFYYGEADQRTLVYTSEIFNGCSSNTISIDTDTIIPLLPENENPIIRDVTVGYSSECGNKTLIPFFKIYRNEEYTYDGKTYANWKYVGYSDNGLGHISNAKMGENQEYRVYHGKTHFEYTFNFELTVEFLSDFDIDLCNGL